MRTLITGRGLVESPRWHDGRLWFADWIAGEILAVTDPGGEQPVASEVVVRHASLPLCFDFRPDGTPLVVSNPEHALLRREPDGGLAPYADLSGAAPLGCNDVVVDGRGHAYVNSAGYDAMNDSPPDEPAGFVVLVRGPGEPAEVVATGLRFPNGMAVTPDNATLIVADSYATCLLAYDIAADGTLGPGRTWADLDGDAPDGICVDAEGAVWYASVPGRQCVRVREGGEVVQRVELDRGGFACMLGGADGRTLYAVAANWPGMDRMADAAAWDGSLFATRVDVPAAGWPGPG